MADALSKSQRRALEGLRDEVKESLYSRADEAHGGSAAFRLAERNMRLREQLDALEGVLRTTAGDGAHG